MIQGTPEGDPRGGYDGHKRKKGGKPRPAVDTPGPLPALVATPADVGDRDRPRRRRAAAGRAWVRAPAAAVGRGAGLGFARPTRFRRLARDYERLAATPADLHVLAFATLMLRQFTLLMACPSAYHALERLKSIHGE